MAKQAPEIPEKVDAVKFDAILKRMIEHKPVPKKSVKASRGKKRGKVLGR